MAGAASAGPSCEDRTQRVTDLAEVTSAVVDRRLHTGQVDADKVQGRIGPRRAGGVAGVAERLARTVAATDHPTHVSRIATGPADLEALRPAHRPLDEG